MPNIRKMSAAMIEEALALYKMGIPILLLAKLYKVSHSTINNNIPPELKTEMNKRGKDSNLEMLKLYANLFMDGRTYVKVGGISKLAELQPILYEHLKIKDWETYLQGAIIKTDVQHQHQFHPEVPKGYRKIIKEVFPCALIKQSNTDVLKWMFKDMLSEPSADKISFPKSLRLDQIEELIRAGIAKFIEAEQQTLYFDERTPEIIRQVCADVSTRELECCESWYGAGEMNVEQIGEKYDLTRDRIRQIAVRAITRMRKRFFHVFKGRLDAMLNVSDIVQEQDAIEKEKQEQIQRITELSIANKMFSSDAFTLADYLKKLSGVAVLPDNVQKIVDQYSNGDQLHRVEAETALSKALATPLEDLELSVRAFNCIKASKINSLTELVQYTQEELMKFRNFGQKSLSEIEQMLHERGLHFGMTLPK